MASAEEQDAQFTAGDVERRVAELERKLALLDEAGLDRLTQSGYLQFDSIPFRWDSNGMQVETSGTNTPAVYFLEDLVADPDFADLGITHPKAAAIILGNVSAANGSALAFYSWPAAGAADGSVTMELVTAPGGPFFFDVEAADVVNSVTAGYHIVADSNQAEHKFTGYHRFASVLTPSQIASNQDNYAPTGNGKNAVWRLSSDAARNITGIVGIVGGQELYLFNVGSFTITLKDESTSSTDINRFALSGDVAIAPDQGVALFYDETTTRWRASSVPGAATVQRVYVNTDAWDQDVGTNYLASMDGGIPTGWNNTGLAVTASGSTGDENSLADVDPAYIRADAAGDYGISDAIFGGYDHIAMVTRILGSAPTKLCAEFLGRFGTPSNWGASNGGGIGFWSDVTAPAAAAKVAVIRLKAGTFVQRLERGDATAGDDGSASDTNWHLYRIEMTFGSTYEWFVDGTSQGTITGATDSFPVGFGLQAESAAGDDVDLANVHVWYE